MRIKHTLYLLALLVISTAFVFNDPLTAETADKGINWLSIEEAYELNKKAPRKTFIDVYTNWCGWCKRMDKDTFSDPDVADFVNKNFYAVKLNAENQEKIVMASDTTTQQMLARSMGVSGYPTIVYMKEDFKTIHVVPGYQKADAFLANLKNVLKWE